jgi:hypothetical protein
MGGRLLGREVIHGGFEVCDATAIIASLGPVTSHPQVKHDGQSDRDSDHDQQGGTKYEAHDHPR